MDARRDSGGREELRELVHPGLRDAVNGLSPAATTVARAFAARGAGVAGELMDIQVMTLRLHDDDGREAGIALTYKPAAGMTVLATIAGSGDLRHFERMQRVARPARRPAAVLFADLEASSAIARRLSTASYFSLGRRLARAADQCVIDAGGLVGRHVGDGVVAFFLAETAASESSAAQACIVAARAIRKAVVNVAARSDLAVNDLVMRFGLHWGATLYVGRSRPAGAPRSPRSGMRSTRALASRRAPQADEPWPRRSCWSASTARTRPRSISTPTASPTHPLQTFPQPRTRPAATPPPSPSARCRRQTCANRGVG